MREIALKIGQPLPLAAIATTPDKFDPEKPAVIILNSGVMHHIGTCRISVKIARHLADNGFLALRFDFSGVGDSKARRGTESFHETAQKEIKEVMDYLEQKKNVQKFIIYGLCSGADGSYDAALVDERIQGIIQIDPYCYRTPKWYLVHYGPRIFKMDVWKRFFTSIFKKRAINKASGPEEEFLEMPSYIRVFPPKNEIASGLQKLVDRNVHIYSIFSGGQMAVFNHHSQFEDSFSSIDFRGLLTVDFYRDMEHIISSHSYQELIPKKICQWVIKVSDRQNENA